MRNFLAILSFLFFSCHSSQLSKTASPEKIEFEKTGCLANCKAYKATVDIDGHAVYEGLSNSPMMGKYSRDLTKEENRSFWDLIHSSQLEAMKDEYDYGAEDTQQKFIRYYLNGKTKEIRFGQNIPDILKKIDAEIEKIAGGAGWTKSPK